MVYEELLTILFAIGVGAAIVIYAAKPRQRSVPVLAGSPAVGSFGHTEAFVADPTPIAIAEAPAVAAPVAPEGESAVEVVPAVADVVAPAPVETTLQTSTAVEAPATPIGAEPVTAAPASSTRPRRTTRRKSTTTRTRARSSKRTKKE